MLELIIGIVLAVVNAAFIVYVVKFMPQKILSGENIDKVVNTAVDVIADRGADFVEEHELDKINLPSLIENLKTGVVTDLIDGVVNKLKMSFMGQKGGLASGESRNRARLLEAAGSDLMNQMPAWLKLVMRQFPSIAEMLQEEPGLIAEIPTLLEEVKNRFGIDLKQFVGSDGNQGAQGPTGFWW